MRKLFNVKTSFRIISTYKIEVLFSLLEIKTYQKLGFKNDFVSSLVVGSWEVIIPPLAPVILLYKEKEG
jgi:hypothetical protein